MSAHTNPEAMLPGPFGKAEDLLPAAQALMDLYEEHGVPGAPEIVISREMALRLGITHMGALDVCGVRVSIMERVKAAFDQGRAQGQREGRKAERAEIASRLAAAAEAACPGDTCHGLPSRYQGHLPGLPCAELAMWAAEIRGSAQT